MVGSMGPGSSKAIIIYKCNSVYIRILVHVLSYTVFYKHINDSTVRTCIAGLLCTAFNYKK